MWQNILVLTIVVVTALFVAWSFYRKITGKSSCCGGCASKGSCSGWSPDTLRPLKDSGCGCGH